MSEYQYYEFQAIDRPLTPEEQQAVAQLSSRVSPHPWRAVFTYSYGGGLYPRAEKVLAEYYDAMIYLSNWGSRQLMFRFPKTLVDPDQMRQYNVETTDYPSDIIQVDIKGKYVVLNIELNEEDGLGWIEGEGWLGALVGLRDAILQGDYRVLYLAWLRGLTSAYDVDEDALEPPMPPGLGKLTPDLGSFVELFDVGTDTIQAAAEQSAPLESRILTDDDLHQAIKTLGSEEKDDFLLRLVQGEPQLSLALKRRLDLLGDDPAGCSSSAHSAGPRRTVSEILSAATKVTERRRKAKAAAAEARPPMDKQHLEQAWRVAADIGRFEYQTNVEQTTRPAARLENAGRSPTRQQLRAEGWVNRPENAMQLRLWSSQTGGQGIELEVEGEKAYGRTNANDVWAEVPNSTNIFAPGGDPLGFLVAAENVHVGGGGGRIGGPGTDAG